jgi:serine/threonine-protein kinase SRPK3
MQLLDHFHVEGPNGKHECLVLELLGPSISDVVGLSCDSRRLLGKTAKATVQQALAGLAFLHKHGIAHGGTISIKLILEMSRSQHIDLHTRNLAFALPSLSALTETEFLQKFPTPEIDAIARKDGKPLQPNMPAYLVKPTSFLSDVSLEQQQIKIIDFGQSFYNDATPEILHNPLCVSPPEVIFGEKLDHHADLWSTGCMVSADPSRTGVSQIANGDRLTFPIDF